MASLGSSDQVWFCVYITVLPRDWAARQCQSASFKLPSGNGGKSVQKALEEDSSLEVSDLSSVVVVTVREGEREANTFEVLL